MAYEQRDNSGTLFKNDKRTTDKHPNATGTALIGGVAYRVSAWTKEGTKGKFQSLSFTLAEEGEKKPEAAKPAARFDDMDAPPF